MSRLVRSLAMMLTMAAALLPVSGCRNWMFVGVHVKSRYQPGQVWHYKTRAGEEKSLLYVLHVLSRNGPVVYIGVDNVRLMKSEATGEAFHSASYFPFTEAALDRSVTDLVASSQMPPKNFEVLGPGAPGPRSSGQRVSEEKPYQMTVAEFVEMLEHVVRREGPVDATMASRGLREIAGRHTHPLIARAEVPLKVSAPWCC